jgi:hypothetical protein
MVEALGRLLETSGSDRLRMGEVGARLRGYCTRPSSRWSMGWDRHHSTGPQRDGSITA